MVSVIADVLKSKLAALEWIDRFGGLVSNATRPELIPGADGAQVVKGYQSYPVACETSNAACWNDGLYKHFEPDSKKAAIAFFVDNGGTSFKSVQGPKNAGLQFNFDLKFLCWMNTTLLGTSITGGGCNPSGRVAPYVTAQLYGYHTAVGLFAGGIEESIYQAIEVTDIRELTKNPTMFEPFFFAKDGVNRGLFLNPYDYFGLNIKGTFIINKNCLPTFGVDWVAANGCETC